MPAFHRYQGYPLIGMRPKLILQEDPVSPLWHLLCSGDKDAFGQITENCYKPLYQYGTKFTDDRELIKDCLQDLFLDIWEKRTHLSGVANPRPYLFQAFRNNLLRRTRRISRFSEIGPGAELEFSSFSSEAEWIHRETEAGLEHKLQLVMKQLPKRQREALYLRYYENLTYEEIADVMGLRRQAVANYLQYGIQKLRAYWQQMVISMLLFLIR